MTRKKSQKRGPTDAAFQETQTYYDKLLKDSGFLDIECGYDINDHDWSTLPPSHVSYGLETIDFSEPAEALADTDTGRRWRLLGQFANRLPFNHANRGFLVDACETGNRNESARNFGLSIMQGRWAWAAFERLCGLPPLTKIGRVRRPDDHVTPPSPVRHLTKKEIHEWKPEAKIVGKRKPKSSAKRRPNGS